MELAKSLHKIYPIHSIRLNGVSDSIQKFILTYISKYDGNTVAIVDIDSRLTLDNLNPKETKTKFFNAIVNFRLINRVRYIVPFFTGVNENLDNEGIFICCVETAEQRKKRLFNKFPRGVNRIYYFFDYLGKRVAPKLPILRKAYYFLTAGRNRVLTRVEILGRLAYCGFEIENDREIDNKLYIIAKKRQTVRNLEEKNYGLLFKMKRQGYKGKMIQVYKFRTMYAYSEYLQDYIYRNNKLDKGGKFKDDFRVNMLGKVIRKLWMDELPMFYNLLKREVKLVGVRPLSEHYLSLYTKELVEKRKNFKPGLIPPYYADLPETLEEIMDSELRYFEAFEKRPFATDISYFFKACKNILIKKARSK